MQGKLCCVIIIRLMLPLNQFAFVLAVLQQDLYWVWFTCSSCNQDACCLLAHLCHTAR